MREPDNIHIYEILAKQHEPMLLAYILSLVPDRTLAEDIAQETFLIAYRKISTLEKKEAFAAWLRGIARNVGRGAHDLSVSAEVLGGSYPIGVDGPRGE